MLRTIQKAFELIRNDDPDTCVTSYSIRQWCKNGDIKYRMSGNRILVDMESLRNFIEIKEKED